MGTKRVINEDTGIYFFEIGSPIATGALTKGNRYLISGKAATGSKLPVGLVVGDIFVAKTALALTSGTADAVKPLTMSKFCGYQNIDGKFTREQIDTTAICDKTSTFRAGRLKVDLSGTLVVETSTGEETATDIVMGNLITLLDEQEDGSYTRSATGVTVNVALVLTEGIVGADVKDLTLYAPANITSGGFSGGANSAKTADVALSVTTGDFEPQFVKEGRAV